MQEYYFIRVIEEDVPEIPQWQQQETLSRLKTLDEHPEIGIDWETATTRIDELF